MCVCIYIYNTYRFFSIIGYYKILNIVTDIDYSTYCAISRSLPFILYIELVVQLYPFLCDPIDCSLPGSVHEFPRQECWSGLPFPSRGDLPYPGIKPKSPAFQADSLPSELPGKPFYIW